MGDGNTKLDENDLARIFEQHGPMVYRRALRLLGSPADAEDAMQEVFIRAFRAAAGFDGRSAVSTWLYSITTNYCLQLLRDRSRRAELAEQHLEAPGADAPSLVSPAMMLLLRHLLAIADEELAQAAVCVYIEGMSHSEAAEVLGVSKRTVGNLVERFLAFANAQAASRTDLPAVGVASLPRRRSP
jgi:RNA polymerase sigma-70 factor (ECF subfamily)